MNVCTQQRFSNFFPQAFNITVNISEYLPVSKAAANKKPKISPCISLLGLIDDK